MYESETDICSCVAVLVLRAVAAFVRIFFSDCPSVKLLTPNLKRGVSRTATELKEREKRERDSNSNDRNNINERNYVTMHDGHPINVKSQIIVALIGLVGAWFHICAPAHIMTVPSGLPWLNSLFSITES